MYVSILLLCNNRNAESFIGMTNRSYKHCGKTMVSSALGHLAGLFATQTHTQVNAHTTLSHSIDKLFTSLCSEIFQWRSAIGFFWINWLYGKHCSNFLVAIFPEKWFPRGTHCLTLYQTLALAPSVLPTAASPDLGLDFWERLNTSHLWTTVMRNNSVSKPESGSEPWMTELRWR